MSCPAGFTFDTEPRKMPFAAMTETIQPGESIHHWDNDIIWSDKHIPASKLEPLRRMGDDLADRALDVLNVKHGEDAYEALLTYTSRPENEQESQAPQLLMNQLMTVPEWVNWEQIRRGQDVYWRYCTFIAHTLLHFSLAGGFALPKIARVLTSTGHLTGDPRRTKRRVYETSQFVVDVVRSLDSLMPGTGLGWKSIVRVRFLHAGVRSRLSRISRAHSKVYSVEQHGIPINQEDLVGTLLSFSNTSWRVMETRMDVHMTMQEREDYLHLWRYVGYMLGVDDVLGIMESPQRADACLESIVLHLASPDVDSGQMCENLFMSMTSKSAIVQVMICVMGLPDPLKMQLAMAEHLLGTEFWKLSGLPAVSPRYRFYRQMAAFFMGIDLWLVLRLPEWWFRARSWVVREGYYYSIAMEIGKRRTNFDHRAAPQDTSKVMQDSGADIESVKSAESCAGGKLSWSKLLAVSVAALGVAVILVQL